MAELIGTATVYQRAQFRDEHGRFISQVREASSRSALQLAQAIEQFAEMAAWSGSKPITAVPGGFSAEAIAHGRLAAIQEFGARPHPIASLDGGPLSNPAEDFFAPSGRVNHPGTRAQRFLSKAAAAASSLAPGILARNFPG